jgi:hypothetical protein
MRLRNVEFRCCQIDKKYELVKWQKCNEKDSCYVIAFFDKTNEGYDMRTVGDRFFDDHDAWIVGKHAIAFLKDTLEEEEEED